MDFPPRKSTSLISRCVNYTFHKLDPRFRPIGCIPKTQFSIWNKVPLGILRRYRGNNHTNVFLRLMFYAWSKQKNTNGTRTSVPWIFCLILCHESPLTVRTYKKWTIFWINLNIFSPYLIDSVMLRAMNTKSFISNASKLFQLNVFWFSNTFYTIQRTRFSPIWTMPE